LLLSGSDNVSSLLKNSWCSYTKFSKETDFCLCQCSFFLHFISQLFSYCLSFTLHLSRCVGLITLQVQSSVTIRMTMLAYTTNCWWSWHMCV